MSILQFHRRQKHLPRVYSLLSASMILLMVFGSLLGPWLLPPLQGQAAPQAQQIEAITIGKAVQSQFSPKGTASYGEILTYTLRYTFTAGSGTTGITLTDSFGNQSNFLTVQYIANSSIGPTAMNGDTPAVAHVTPTVTPRSGRPLLVWRLQNIPDHPTADYVYQILYNVRVYYDNSGATARQAINTATLTYSGGSAGAPVVTVSLVQPNNFTFNKDQDPPSNPSTELSPGAPITWTLSMQNQAGANQGTAYDVVITDTMPTRTGNIYTAGDYTPTPCGSYCLRWDIPSLAVGASEAVTIFASIPLTDNVAHAPLANRAGLVRSSAPGNVAGERIFTRIDRSTQAYIQNISIGKSQYSPLYTDNSRYQAVAGELVTATVVFTVPQGIVIYNPWMRILIEDGLTLTKVISPAGSTPNVISNPNFQDPYRPSGSFTQYEWTDLPSIVATEDGPVTVTYILQLQARQRYWLHSIGQNVPHNTLLRIVPIVRWADLPGREPNQNDTSLRQRNDTSNSTVSVQFLRPDLRNIVGSTNGSYFETTGQFQGDGTVRFVLHLKNRTETPAHPIAYEVVVTDTLSSKLHYVSAVPTPVMTETIPGVGTRIHWSVLSNPIGSEQKITITATLPPTMTAGTSVTSTANARYTTFSGSPVYEGIYYDAPPESNPAYTAQSVLRGGYAIAKYSYTRQPSKNVYIGDKVTYTVALTLNPGITMYTPAFDDVLPKGFHYVAGSMTVSSPGSLVGQVQVTRTAAFQEKILWNLATVQNLGENPISIYIRYQAVQTGQDNHSPAQDVYAASRADFVGRIQADNQIGLCWHASSAPTAPHYCLGTPYPKSSVWIVQPFLGDDATFKKYPLTSGEYEVGKTVHFVLETRNTGQAYGYNLVFTDTLPPGMAIQESWATAVPVVPTITLLLEPTPGSTGVVTWTIDQIIPNQIVSLHYDAVVLSSAVPGDELRNIAHIADYRSQPAGVPDARNYKPFDRRYYPNPDPIPTPASCAPFYVLGVSMTKTDQPDPVVPGGTLTYTLAFGNSSKQYASSNVLITDTYDVHLTYMPLSTTVSDPDIVGVLQEPGLLVWRISSLPAGGSLTDYWIRPVFVVDEPMSQNDTTLINYAAIDGQGDLTGKVERVEETTVKMPFLNMRKTAAPAAVNPGQQIVYTIAFTNIGPLAATEVWIEDSYDPNVLFVTATPPPYPGSNNSRWFIQELTPTAHSAIVVTVQVIKPVPSGVEYVYNRTRASCAENTPTDWVQAETRLFVPKLFIGVSDSPDPVDMGVNLDYTIRYTNSGSMTATGGKVTATLDAYADTLVTANPWPGNNCSGGVCIWSVGAVGMGAANTIALTVHVDSSIPGSIVRLTANFAVGSGEVGPRTVTVFTDLKNRGFKVYLPLVIKAYSGAQTR